MSKLNFDLNAALNGASVQTRDGRTVTDIKIVTHDAPHSAESVDELNGGEYIMGIEAKIHNKHFSDTYPFYHSGGSHKYGIETGADLTTDF